MRVYITVYNLYYVVTPVDALAKSVVDYVLSKLSTYEWVYNRQLHRNTRILDKTFAAVVPHNNTFRFNINTLKDFMLVLGTKGISRNDIEINMDIDYKIAPMDCLFSSKIKLRPYQQSYSELLVKDTDEKFQLVDLPPGKGKTIIAVHAVTTINRRTLILVLPGYIKKWVSDIKFCTDTTDDEIYVARGHDGIVSLLEEVKETGISDLPYNFIIIGTNTMYNYIKKYETEYLADYNYDSVPGMFTRELGVGTVLNDETHQQFHSVYKSMLYLDGKQFIGLSATLINNDAAKTRMYNTMFPGKSRLSKLIKISRFVDIYAVMYKLRNSKRVQYKRQKGYNHNLYESSMFRRTNILKDYIDMILHYLKIGHIDRAKKNEKCLIFVASVNMATLLTNTIAKKYPSHNVKRYVEDDPYEYIMTGEITVSTIGE